MPTESRTRSERHFERTPDHADVGHSPRMLDQRLDAAKRFGKREQPGTVTHVNGGRFPGVHAKKHHAAKCPHLFRGDLVTSVGWQTRIQNL